MSSSVPLAPLPPLPEDGNLAAITQPFEPPRVFGWTFSLSVFIGVIGLGLSLLFFITARDQTQASLVRQFEIPVNDVIKSVQRDIDRDENLMDVSAGYLSASFDKTGLLSVIENPGALPTTLEHLLIADIDQTEMNITQEIPLRTQSNVLKLDSAERDQLEKMVRYTSGTHRASSAVLEDASGHSSKWLVFARPIIHGTFGSGKREHVLLGFANVNRVLNDLLALRINGSLSKIIIMEDTGVERMPFLSIKSEQKLLPGFLTLPEPESTLFLSDRNWRVHYGVTMTPGVLILSGVPYLELIISLLLVSVLILYLHATRKRSAKIAQLAYSLRHANDGLNHSIDEEKRMAKALTLSERRYRTLFDNAGIGIFQAAGNGNWLNANSTLAVMLGYEDAAELLARPTRPERQIICRQSPAAGMVWPSA